jgi:threonine dehydrogenase-like Zn-dependent dehydrogenase
LGIAMADPRTATAYWSIPPGAGELRAEPLPDPGPDEALVRTLHSGISRGTELLVHRGLVPPSQAERMRAPHQAGDFPGPVKYGYLSVGVVEQGPADWVGRQVFSLHPHQDAYVVPVSALTALPGGVPARRAVLAGAVETAINAVWDAAPRAGDRVAVVGAGLIGSAVAGVLRSFPLERLQLIDVDPGRAGVATGFGIDFAQPDQASADCDLVVHASGSGAGLSRCLELAGEEAEVIELSWYGSGETGVRLGADFHSRRLTIRASQVGTVSAARRARRTPADRLRLALEVLRDDAFDVLLSGPSPFSDLPEVMSRLASGQLDAICQVIDYPAHHPAGEA